MKKIKKIKKKPMAEYGYNFNQDPWQQINPNQNFQYPNAQPITYSQWDTYNDYVTPASINPNQPTPSNSSNTNSGTNWNAIGKTAANVGKQAGQLLSGAIGYGIQGLNALIPEQSDPRKYRQYQPVAYNPYSMGSGSQAIYADGGALPDTYTTSYKKNNIAVTEEVPEFTPINSSNYFNPQFTPIESHSIPQPSYISFDKLYQPNGKDYSYMANFNHMNYNQAMQSLQSLPNDFNSIPVEKSPSFYQEANNGFIPGSQSYQWTPVQDYSNVIPIQEDEYMKNGGSINIKKSKRGSLHKALGIPEGEKIPASKLAIKPTDSPALKRKKQFAINSKSWSKKENGGYIEGQEYDLKPEEIRQLISLGYKIEF